MRLSDIETSAVTRGVFVNLHFFKSLTKADSVALGVFTAMSIWFYAGFFFPGSYMLLYPIPSIILWFVRIILPLLFIGVIFLYTRIRRHKITKGEIALLFAACFVGLYVCYGIADSLYQLWFESERVEYHPYLQVKPVFDKRLNDTTSQAMKVFCFGGSTTEFSDHKGKDWPSRVEAILRQHHGLQNIQVYNLGRGWYTSLHTLINYETNLRKHRPSVILIMQSINDVFQNADFGYMSRGAFREDYGHFYGPVSRIVDRRSLWQYLRSVFQGVWYATDRKSLTVDHFPGLKAYERNIKTIIELARHDSAKVILMTEPFLAKRNMPEEELACFGMTRAEALNDTVIWSSETLVNGMEQYNKTMQTIARQNNLPLIDLEKQIPKSPLYFRDEVHYQDTTFSIIAPFVAGRLFEYLSAERMAGDSKAMPEAKRPRRKSSGTGP